MLRIFNARPAGNLGGGHGIVAGNDLDGNALGLEIGKGIRRLGADAVDDENQSQGLQPSGYQAPQLRLAGIFCNQQNPVAGSGPAFHFFPQLLVAAAHDKFRGTHHKGTLLPEQSGTPFCFGCKGNSADAVPIRLAGEHFRHSPAGIVVRLQAGIVGSEDLLQKFRWVRGQRHHIVHFHNGFCDGAGFVHAQHVHPGQGFDAVHILHQHLFPGQLQRRNGHGHTGQQV